MRATLVLGLLVALAAPALAQKEKLEPGRKIVIERVVAVVNDTVILDSEIAQRARSMMGDIDKIQDQREKTKQYRALLHQVVNDLVDEELIIQAAAEAKLEVTDAEVEKALDEVKRQNKVTNTQLEQALLMQGYSMENYRKDVRKQILRLRAINILVRPRVAVTDDEVKEQYDKMIGKSASVTEVHVRGIVFKLPEHPSEAQMDTARRNAGNVVERVRAGEDFTAVATQLGQPKSDMGTFKRGELPTEWEEVIFAMSEGEVRGPFRGPQGLHVFQLVDAKKEAVRSFEEVKEQLRNQIYSEEMEKQTKVWLEELHKKAHVEIKL